MPSKYHHGGNCNKDVKQNNQNNLPILFPKEFSSWMALMTESPMDDCLARSVPHSKPTTNRKAIFAYLGQQMGLKSIKVILRWNNASSQSKNCYSNNKSGKNSRTYRPRPRPRSYRTAVVYSHVSWKIPCFRRMQKRWLLQPCHPFRSIPSIPSRPWSMHPRWY